jgi:hypothetical protein
MMPAHCCYSSKRTLLHLPLCEMRSSSCNTYIASRLMPFSHIRQSESTENARACSCDERLAFSTHECNPIYNVRVCSVAFTFTVEITQDIFHIFFIIIIIMLQAFGARECKRSDDDDKFYWNERRENICHVGGCEWICIYFIPKYCRVFFDTASSLSREHFKTLPAICIIISERAAKLILISARKGN